MRIFAEFCHEVIRDWKVGQDGEVETSMESIASIHIDPDGKKG